MTKETRELRRGHPAAWRLFFRSRIGVAGLVIILLFGMAALTYPLLRSTVLVGEVYDPLFGYDFDVAVHPSSPGPGHPLGTDSLGRDVLSMLLAASRPTWVLAMTAALVTALVGLLVASVAAYHKGMTDSLLSHMSSAFLLLPAPLLLLIIGTGDLGQKIGPVQFGVIYGLVVGLGAAAIVLRTDALQVMAKPFMEAARVAGASGWRVIGRHLIPHMIPLAALVMMLAVVGAVVADGFASWLGQTGTRLSWGVMIYYAVTFPALSGPAWNAILPAGVALSIFAAAFYMVSVGLRQVVDPRRTSANRRA